MFQNKPDVLTVANFITELQGRVKMAYKNEFLKFDDASPMEYKKSQIEWLNRIEIISDIEATNLLEELSNKKNDDIGFKN